MVDYTEVEFVEFHARLIARSEHIYDEEELLSQALRFILLHGLGTEFEEHVDACVTEDGG